MVKFLFKSTDPHRWLNQELEEKKKKHPTFPDQIQEVA